MPNDSTTHHAPYRLLAQRAVAPRLLAPRVLVHRVRAHRVLARWATVSLLAAATGCSGGVGDGGPTNIGGGINPASGGQPSAAPGTQSPASTAGSVSDPLSPGAQPGTDATSADTGANAPGGTTPALTTPGGTDQIPSTDVTGTATTSPPTVNADCTAGAAPLVYRVIPRLNRAEYNNTVRDLIGDQSNLALADLPPDQGDGSFDNNTAALSTNPALVEVYFSLGEELAAAAMAGAGRAKIVTCDPGATGEDACARQIASEFGARGYRRPLDAAEVDSLVGVYSEVRAQGFTFDEGVTAIVQSVLTSPHFLYRAELDSTQTGERPVNGYELANRLSYFIWSSMPDQALFDAAAQGALDSPAGVEAQARRMLADAKAEAFYTRFPSLWLRMGGINERPPATEVFPTYDDALGEAMVTETSLFMRDFMTGDLNFLDFLDADFTYVNQRLAQHYGLPGTFGQEFTRVSLAGNEERGGILTQASVLKITSPSERTSPVIRGSYILARILNTPAPPPPDTIVVPDLEETVAATPLTTRERLELHRADPVCAACHDIIDPLGFGLEHYDGIGAWRETENGVAVDASSVLSTGESLNGHKDLAALLKADPRTARGIVSYVMSYALGRLPTAADSCRIDALNATFSASGYHMQDLLVAVATDNAMLNRKIAP